MTLTARAVPTDQVVLQILAEADLSGAMPEDLEPRPVSGSWFERPVGEVLDDVVGPSGFAAVVDGGRVVFRRREDVAQPFVSIPIAGFDAKVAEEAAAALLGKGASTAILGDRLLVSGPPDVLDAARDLGRELGRLADGWLVEVEWIRLDRGFSRTLGLGLGASGQGTLAVGGRFGRDFPAPVVGATARLAVSAIAEALEDSRLAASISAGRVFVREGSAASLRVGGSVPIPLRAVNEAGVVVTTGYQTIKTGYDLQVTARRVEGGVLLGLRPSISEVVGFVEEAPILTSTDADVSVVVDSGGVVILSGLSTASASKTDSGLPGLAFPWGQRRSAEESDTELVLVCRVQRTFRGGYPTPAAGSVAVESNN